MKFLVLLLACVLGAAAVDPRFSHKSCIVIGEVHGSVCEQGLGEVKADPLFNFISEDQIVFNNIDDAITYCPFTPALVEVMGVVRSRGDVSHPNNHLIIKGVANEFGMPASIVGLTGLRVGDEGAIVELKDFVAEGCNTEKGIFSENHLVQGCLVERSLLVNNVAFNYYNGPRVLCQVSFNNRIYLEVVNSGFFEVQQTAIEVIGGQTYKLNDNFYRECGSESKPCVVINPDNSRFYADAYSQIE